MHKIAGVLVLSIFLVQCNKSPGVNNIVQNGLQGKWKGYQFHSISYDRNNSIVKDTTFPYDSFMSKVFKEIITEYNGNNFIGYGSTDSCQFTILYTYDIIMDSIFYSYVSSNSSIYHTIADGNGRIVINDSSYTISTETVFPDTGYYQTLQIKRIVINATYNRYLGVFPNPSWPSKICN